LDFEFARFFCRPCSDCRLFGRWGERVRLPGKGEGALAKNAPVGMKEMSGSGDCGSGGRDDAGVWKEAAFGQHLLLLPPLSSPRRRRRQRRARS